MKVAYLILAHRQPAMLARLIEALRCDWAWFFIHLDRQVDSEPFCQALPNRERVAFLAGDERLAVTWGGFSLVEATLKLVACARESGQGFTRYTLLSGADFPIKPLSLIAMRFAGQREFMRVDRRLSGAGSTGTGQGRMVRRYFFMDWPLPRRLKSEVLSRLLPRRPYAGLPLYHGAQWWSLTAACVDHILEFLTSRPDYLRFHRFSLCPDEIVFHSIVKQSPFAGQLAHDFETAADQAAHAAGSEHGCHYIDWHADQATLPKVLDLDDLPALLGSTALFARKFDAERSRPLLSELVRHCGFLEPSLLGGNRR